MGSDRILAIFSIYIGERVAENGTDFLLGDGVVTRWVHPNCLVSILRRECQNGVNVDFNETGQQRVQWRPALANLTVDPRFYRNSVLAKGTTFQQLIDTVHR